MEMTAAKIGRRMKRYLISGGSLIAALPARVRAWIGGAAEGGGDDRRVARTASVVSLLGSYATGRTGASGLIFWAPSTMTLSPGLRPSSMIHWVPCQAVALTVRALTLLLSVST